MPRFAYLYVPSVIRSLVTTARLPNHFARITIRTDYRRADSKGWYLCVYTGL